MILRWQANDYAMTTLSDVDEFTLLGVYGMGEEFADRSAVYDLPTVVSTPEPLDDRGMVEVTLYCVVRRPKGDALYQIRCIGAWLCSDQADTIDTLVRTASRTRAADES